MPLYTVGHSNHSPERFLNIVSPFLITHIIDIRSVPYSGRYPHFNRDNLKKITGQAGMIYEWQGDCLGGLLENGESYDEKIESESFKHAVNKIVNEFHEAKDGNTACLVCAEKDPSRCHRSILLGPVFLNNHHVDLHHILADGTLILQSDLEISKSNSDRAGTLSLFDETEKGN